MSIDRFILCAIFSMLCFHSTLAQAGGFDVGNGGDAVSRNGKLYLRDFAEASITDHLYFGTFNNPDMNGEAAGIHMEQGLTFSKNLLVQKLTDLEALVPGFGYLIARALQKYQIVMASAPLSVIADSNWDDKTDPRTQVAIRLGEEIRISKIRWDQLDQADQIGLLFHEAIYSLSKPDCIDKSSSGCTPVKNKVRQLTALVFQKISPNDPALKSALTSLNLKLTPRSFCSGPAVSGYMMATNSQYPNIAKAFGHFDVEANKGLRPAVKMINDACHRQYQEDPRATHFILTVSMRSVTLSTEEYFDEFGYQMSLAVVPTTTYRTIALDVDSDSSCRDNYIFNFFNALILGRRQTPLEPTAFCEWPDKGK